MHPSLGLPRLVGGLLLVLASVTACGGGRDAPDPRADGVLRIALLTSGPVSDAGWYAGAYEGLMLLRDSLGAEVSHQLTRRPAEFDEAFEAYASRGYDIIFAHGFEYQDAAIRAGARFPHVTIIVSGGGRYARNVVPLIFQLEEATYLAGMVAGGMTRSGTVGLVGGVEIPSVEGTFLSFEAGARAMRPDVRVLTTFTGSWDDVGAAKEAAVAQLGQGADVLMHNLDAASFAVFQAVREAVARGRRVWALGMNRDQNDVAPDVILGSAVIRIPQAFLEAVQLWQEGALGGAPVYAGGDDGVVDFVFNPALLDRIPAELVRAVDEAREAIFSGALEVPRIPFVEGPEPGA